MGHSEIIALQYRFQKQKYSRHSVLFKDGDPIDYIYLILEGEIQICANVRSSSITKDKLGQSKKSKIVSVKLETIGPDSFVGEDDLLLERATRTYTAIAQCSPTVVFRMAKSSLPFVINDIKKEFPNIFRRAAEKNIFRKERIGKHGEAMVDLAIPKKYTSLENKKFSEKNNILMNDKQYQLFAEATNNEVIQEKKRESQQEWGLVNPLVQKITSMSDLEREQNFPNYTFNEKLIKELVDQKGELERMRDPRNSVDIEVNHPGDANKRRLQRNMEASQTPSRRSMVSSFGNVLGGNKVYGESLLEKIKVKLEEHSDARRDTDEIQTILRGGDEMYYLFEK